MNRREFLKSIITTIVYSQVPIDFSTQPLPVLLYGGIPYHEYNASTDTWLGITRTTYPEIKLAYTKATGYDI